MMRYMGLPRDSVIILHMGGVYNDKPATIERFKHTFTTRLTDEMRARLVLENDEMCYSVDDLLPVCQELGVPIVLDYHHNWINVSLLLWSRETRQCILTTIIAQLSLQSSRFRRLYQ